jgi:peptide/nickel transport system substrate-binding protein
MNPLVATSSNDKWIRELMFEPLLGIDLRGQLQPNLAERWTVSDDGTLYTFELRKGVRFHNGQEMTADDAKFAIDYTLNPANGAYGRTRLGVIDRVEAIGPYSLRVYLTQPAPAFLSQLTTIQSFSVVPRDSIPEGVEKPGTFPPGTGPFKFVEWQPKQRVVLERYDDYWGRKALLDRVVLRPIEDGSVRFTALRAGDVDLVVRVPLEWTRQLVSGELRGLVAFEAPQGALHRIQFNTAIPPFDDKRLRQAVAHAIDKKEILDAAFYGFGEPVDQKYPRGHVWHFDGVPSPAYDPERARPPPGGGLPRRPHRDPGRSAGYRPDGGHDHPGAAQARRHGRADPGAGDRRLQRSHAQGRLCVSLQRRELLPGRVHYVRAGPRLRARQPEPGLQ